MLRNLAATVGTAETLMWQQVTLWFGVMVEFVMGRLQSAIAMNIAKHQTLL